MIHVRSSFFLCKHSEMTPTTNQKSWKRPASASESDKKLAENRRAHNNTLSGSDGEKDRR